MNDLVNAVTNPRAFFLALAEAEERKWLVAMAAILIVACLSAVIIGLNTDVEQVMRTSIESGINANFELEDTSGMTSEELETREAQRLHQIEAQLEQATGGGVALHPAITILTGLVGTVIGLWLVVVILATYFKVVSSILSVESDWSDWMAFVWWTKVPLIVGSVIAAVVSFVVTIETGLEVSVLSPFYWIEGTESQALVGFDLISIWTIALMAIGFSVWTDKDIQTSVVVAIVPYVVYYGGTYMLGTMLGSLLAGAA